MKKQIVYAVLFVASASLFNLSCQKEITKTEERQKVSSVANNSNQINVNRINVSSLSLLYAAVNNPDNTGSLVVLLPGTYILDASYPNAGRLELQHGMQLQGQPGHPDLVIIDASALPGTSFNPPHNFPAPRTGAIRTGRGFNSIEWLTVIGNSSAQALSVIDTDLIWPGISSVRIAHTIVTGGRIGVDIRNVGRASAERILEAEIDDNEIVNNLVQFGQGIEVQNANGASGAIIRASLNGNHIHGNKIGMRSFNNNSNNTNTDSGNISIKSNADRFDENGIGIFLSAGLNQGSTSTANRNALLFEAHGTSIRNNLGILPPDVIDPSPGGIYAVGGFSTNGGVASNNGLEIDLWGCLISGNQGPDINAYGAFAFSATPAGTNNVAEIQLHGVSSNTIVIATPSLPIEASGTNIVNIIQ